MRVLITGAAGQLGSDLARLLPDAIALDRRALAITEPEAVRAAVAGAGLVLNCAAYNAVDQAEATPEPALAANAEGPGLLAAACREAGARLVHFSTNYVFDGQGGRPHRESEPTSPLGVYARSKLEGERRVLAELPSALVIRSSGLFGAAGSAVKGGSFPERIVARARQGQCLRVVDDQRLNPTWTGDLAAGAIGLCEAGLTGVVHLVAAGCASYWELAVATLALAGIEAKVEPVSSAEFPAAAPRPPNGCLESERVPPLREWRQGLADYWAAYQARPAVRTQPI